jgi:PAS domain S-box-containing protein
VTERDGRHNDAVVGAMRAFAAATRDYPKLLATVVEQVAEQVGDGCILALLSDDRASLVPAAVHFNAPEAMAAARPLLNAVPVPADGSTLGARLLRTSGDLLIEDLDVRRLGSELTPGFAGLLTALNARGVVCVALRIHGTAVGLMVVLRREGSRALTDADRATLRGLAEPAALAISNAQLLESLKREVAERTQAEETASRYVALIQHSDEMIAMANIDGSIAFVNDAGRRLLGLAHDADLAGLSLGDFHTQEGMRRREVLRTTGRWAGEAQLRNVRTGELIDTQASSFLVRGRAGEPIGFATVQRDIREAKKLEAQVREMGSRLLAQLDQNEEPRRVVRDAPGPTSAASVFGVSPAMARVRELAELAVTHDEPVLLLGGTGSGKGHLAQWIRDRGPRASEPFVALNCSSLTGDLLVSELFGSARGAFTSAVRDRKGLIEEADGGTLFLDEIGEMDAGCQAQVLKVIEEKRFRRVGETRERRSAFRLICATHRDLAGSVRERGFRADLYYRINVFPITLPELRERTEDIPLLARSILESVGAATVSLPDELVELLAAQPWPGNVRELRNVLIRAVLFARGAPLRAEHFPGLHRPSSPRPPAARAVADDPPRDALPSHDELVALLARHRGNRSRVAKELRISRTTLYRYLELRGLDSDPSG